MADAPTSQLNAAKKFGGKLFDAVFADDVFKCFLASQSVAVEQGAGLRIRLRLNDAPELADLPWELLFDQSRNFFLGLSRETPIVRYLELPQLIRPLAIQLPLRLLVVISSPTDYPPLDTEKEWQLLNDALGDLQRRGVLVIERLERATLNDLRRALRRTETHILHFMGHGGFDADTNQGALIFEDERGRGIRVGGVMLGTILMDSQSLRLVTLMASEGARTSRNDPFARIAQALVQQDIPSVVGMQFEMTDNAALTFTREFYSAVADGYPMDAAVSEARKAIYANGNEVEWATPVLYTRVPDGVIFDIQAEALKQQSVKQSAYSTSTIIAGKRINLDWIEIPETATVRQVRDTIPREARRKQWIVTPRGGNAFAVYQIGELIDYLVDRNPNQTATRAILNQRISQLENFLASLTQAAVDSSTPMNDIRESWNAASDPPLVVLERGVPIGVLSVARRGGSGDVRWLDQESPSGYAEEGFEIPKQAGKDTFTFPQEVERATILFQRKINVRFDPPDQAATALHVSEVYTLMFSVDLERLSNSINLEGVDSIGQPIATAGLDEARLFPPNVDEVELFVHLLSDDLEILTAPQKLIVPRYGKSRNRARFDISPKANGVGELTAVFLADGNAVQAIELKLNVGVEGQRAVESSESLGRPVEAAGAVKPRALSLWIDYIGAGFKISFLGPNEASSFVIPLQLQELEQAIAKARAALQGIVDFQEKNQLVYQVSTTIPASAKNKTLPQLARAGFLLFQTIFNHPGSGQPAKDFAKRLREMAKEDGLNIQIISKEMSLPWGILYVSDRFDPNNIDPELFLGLKHIIEHAPMEPAMDFPTSIGNQPQLTVSLNLNTEIDKQMNFPLVVNQQKYWDRRRAQGGVNVITRSSSSGLLDALDDPNTRDQIIYLYCHAISRNLSEGGANASALQFGSSDRVTLQDFQLSAPADIRLAGAPLVILNAVESAELSPLFYNGFMPYLVDKGARGVIGTVAPVPARFGADWAEKFFDQFLAGKPLGQVMLDLARDYFFNHNNMLGLLYGLYCDADTQITPALLDVRPAK